MAAENRLTAEQLAALEPGDTVAIESGLRDGLRVGGGTRAELVNAQPDESAAQDLLRRQTRQIDVLYRAWSRRRGDLEALRELHAAISERIAEVSHPSLDAP